MWCSSRRKSPPPFRESDKTLRVQAFITCDDVDKVYFDKPYYLTPDKMAPDAFACFAKACARRRSRNRPNAYLCPPHRTVLLRPHDTGPDRYDPELRLRVRSAKEAFKEIPDIKIEGEMLDLAKHIIGMRRAPSRPKNLTTATMLRSPN